MAGVADGLAAGRARPQLPLLSTLATKYEPHAPNERRMRSPLGVDRNVPTTLPAARRRSVARRGRCAELAGRRAPAPTAARSRSSTTRSGFAGPGARAPSSSGCSRPSSPARCPRRRCDLALLLACSCTAVRRAACCARRRAAASLTWLWSQPGAVARVRPRRAARAPAGRPARLALLRRAAGGAAAACSRRSGSARCSRARLRDAVRRALTGRAHPRHPHRRASVGGGERVEEAWGRALQAAKQRGVSQPHGEWATLARSVAHACAHHPRRGPSSPPTPSRCRPSRRRRRQQPQHGPDADARAAQPDAAQERGARYAPSGRRWAQPPSAAWTASARLAARRRRLLTLLRPPPRPRGVSSRRRRWRPPWPRRRRPPPASASSPGSSPRAPARRASPSPAGAPSSPARKGGCPSARSPPRSRRRRRRRSKASSRPLGTTSSMRCRPRLPVPCGGGSGLRCRCSSAPTSSWSLPPSSPSRRRRRRRRRPPSSRRRSTRASPTTPASFGRRPSSVPAPWSRSRRSWRPR